MKIILTICLFLTIVSSIPNRAKYIKEAGRPLNIAHRGLCSILPENTLEAFEAALYQGADFIQLDVVYTKQKIPLVMHDPYLTRITNIRQKKEFADRTQTRFYDGKNMQDWWTDKFSLQELKTLGIKQNQAPGRLAIFDYKFTFPTLGQVIEMVIKFNLQFNGKRNPDKRLAGILIQAKDSQMYRDLYGIEIGQTILQTLRYYNISTINEAQKICPIYLHSFDYGTVKYWAQHTQLPRNYLLEGNTSFDLSDVYRYATGIGFQDVILWDYEKGKLKSIFSETRSYGLLIHIWTFKDDMPAFFNTTDNLSMYKMAQNTLQLDGVITQFADIYAPLAQLYRRMQNIQKQKQQPHQRVHLPLKGFLRRNLRADKNFNNNIQEVF